MSHVVDRSPAEAGRAALARHDWQEAFDALSSADAAGALSAEELMLLADAAWWVGRMNDSIEARERAFASFLKADEPELAAWSAARLATDHVIKGAHPLANA